MAGDAGSGVLTGTDAEIDTGSGSVSSGFVASLTVAV